MTSGTTPPEESLVVSVPDTLSAPDIWEAPPTVSEPFTTSVSPASIVKNDVLMEPAVTTEEFWAALSSMCTDVELLGTTPVDQFAAVSHEPVAGPIQTA